MLYFVGLVIVLFLLSKDEYFAKEKVCVLHFEHLRIVAQYKQHLPNFLSIAGIGTEG